MRGDGVLFLSLLGEQGVLLLSLVKKDTVVEKRGCPLPTTLG